MPKGGCHLHTASHARLLAAWLVASTSDFFDVLATSHATSTDVLVSRFTFSFLFYYALTYYHYALLLY